MFDLIDAAIIIPVRIDHEQRRVNLERNLAFLKAHLNTTIIVIEQDGEQKVPDSRFIEDGDMFHKTRLFNIAVRECPKSMYFFLDVDVLVDPQSYQDAYTAIVTSKTTDLCLLYKRLEYEYVEVSPIVLEQEPDPLKWMPILRNIQGVPAKCSGGVVAVEHNLFWNAGGFNERFIGYGEEDEEIIVRLKRFGARYSEMSYSIYHQTHEIQYRSNTFLYKDISPYLLRFSRNERLDLVRSVLLESDTRFVSIQKTGGRLGNILFELSYLLCYAKITGRTPCMNVPSQYDEFFKPIMKLLHPYPTKIRPTKIKSQQSYLSVFSMDVPLVLSKDPFIEVCPGYAQSSLYLPYVKWSLRKHLSSKDTRKPSTLVMVHVRRKDYLENKHIYSELGEVYYTRAMAAMKAQIPECQFVVFSDDVASVKELPYFQREDVTFFDDSGMSDFAVLQEMTLYSNFILANSTFSWWGAQLSVSQTFVVAPLHWSPVESSNCLGFWTPIYEQSWLRISNYPMTIQTSCSPLFDAFKPKDHESSDVYIHVEDMSGELTSRPNAKIVILVTSNLEKYVYSQKPDIIDYIAATYIRSLDIPHASWHGRPVLCLPLNNLSRFHLLQSIAETLLKAPPQLSILMATPNPIKYNTLFQTLDSIYRQSFRNWNIFFMVPYALDRFESGVYMTSCIAIPNLLPVMPIQSFFVNSVYTRSNRITTVYGGTVLHENKLKIQMELFQPNTLSITNVYDREQLVPYSSFSRSLVSFENLESFYCTCMFDKTGLTENYSKLNPSLRIHMCRNVDVRVLSHLFAVPVANETPQAENVEPPKIVRNVVTHPLVSGSVAIINEPVRARNRLIVAVNEAKQRSGLKFLI